MKGLRFLLFIFRKIGVFKIMGIVRTRIRNWVIFCGNFHVDIRRYHVVLLDAIVRFYIYAYGPDACSRGPDERRLLLPI